MARLDAHAALKEGGGEAVPVLAKLLREDAEPEVRGTAAYFCAIGEPARPSVSVLLEALRDSDSHVRGCCRHAGAGSAPRPPRPCRR